VRLTDEDFKGYSGKSVAIVGGAGYLRDRDYAGQIDEHDIVVRFVTYPISGWEHIIGKKTTARFFDSYSFGGYDGYAKERYTPGRIEPCDIFVLQKLLRPELKEAGINHFKGHNIYFLSKEFYASCCERLPRPTMGMIATMFFTDLGKDVDLFGFDFYESDPLNYYYFYNDQMDTSHISFQNIKANKCHNFANEKDFVLRLENEGKLRLYR